MARKAKSRADLLREIGELKAQLASNYHFASLALPKAANLMASGVVVTLTALGGREIMPPVLITDGLSAATIDALLDDIARSYARATELKPKAR